MIRLRRRKKTPVDTMRERIQSVSSLSDVDWREQFEAGRERAAEARERLAEARERAREAQEQLQQTSDQAREAQERVPDLPQRKSRLRFPTGLLVGFVVGVIVALVLIWRAGQNSAGRAQPTNIELLPRRGDEDSSGAAGSS